jgi:hypothetical protein
VTNQKGKIMTTATAEVDVAVRPARTSVWDRVGSYLRTWGQRIKEAAQNAGDFLVRGAKWLWRNKATQWVVSKFNQAANAVVSVARGPVGKIVVPVAAVAFAPRTLVTVAILALLATIGVKLYRETKPEDITGSNGTKVDRSTWGPHPLMDGNKVAQLAFNDEPTDPDETIEARLWILDEQLKKAKDEKDESKFSEALGRIHFLEVKEGLHKLAPHSSWEQIYRDCKALALEQDPDFHWDTTMMQAGIQNEQARLKQIVELKGKQAGMKVEPKKAATTKKAAAKA